MINELGCCRLGEVSLRLEFASNNLVQLDKPLQGQLVVDNTRGRRKVKSVEVVLFQQIEVSTEGGRKERNKRLIHSSKLLGAKARLLKTHQLPIKVDS